MGPLFCSGSLLADDDVVVVVVVVDDDDDIGKRSTDAGKF